MDREQRLPAAKTAALTLRGATTKLDSIWMESTALLDPRENVMSDALERLKTGLENGKIDLSLLADVEKEYHELGSRMNELEELLIMIVRTGWPWDEEGEPNAIFHTGKDGFTTAMVAARDLLGLGQRSRITRTEPRT
jgi:hypothetical protein